LQTVVLVRRSRHPVKEQCNDRPADRAQIRTFTCSEIELRVISLVPRRLRFVGMESTVRSSIHSEGLIEILRVIKSLKCACATPEFE
jgi:hypothetical protein